MDRGSGIYTPPLTDLYPRLPPPRCLPILLTCTCPHTSPTLHSSTPTHNRSCVVLQGISVSEEVLRNPANPLLIVNNRLQAAIRAQVGIRDTPPPEELEVLAVAGEGRVTAPQ